jgi:protein-L-isoaspartate O-methyltransferase
MRAFYQTEWLGISFFGLAETSGRRLADSKFYDAFYRAVFQKYAGYEALDPEWRQIKDEITDWLAARIPDGARVLSVGCGLGYMEQRLWRKHGDRLDLHVQDYASESLRWLRQVMPAEHIHDANENEKARLTEPDGYDLIYLSGVDYALPDSELIALLSRLTGRLRKNGRILVISGSFAEESVGQRFIRAFKEATKWLLERFGLYKRGQLWGWMRSRKEYRGIMREAGLAAVADGFIDAPHRKTYWIQGDGVSSE